MPKQQPTQAELLAENKNLRKSETALRKQIAKREKALAALQESERFYRVLAEHAQDWETWENADGSFRYVSPACKHICGYSPSAFYKDPHLFSSLILPADQQAWADHRHDVSTAPGLQEIQFRIQRKDGETRWIEHLCQPVLDENGKFSAYHARNRDITARVQTKTELVQLRQAVDSSGEAIFLTDRDGLITHINPEFTRLYGYTVAEVIGKTTPRILKSGLMQARDYEIFWNTILNKQVVRSQITNKTKDGRFVTIEGSANPILDERENIIGFLAIQHDITPRVQAEDDIRRTNRALRMLSESNQILGRSTDETSLLQDICRAIVELGGYRLAWVGYAEQDQAKSVRPVAQAGYEDGYLETLRLTWADTRRGRGPAGVAIRSGQPVIANDIQSDPEFAPWRADAIRRGYASSMALPLRVGEQVIGTLNVYAARSEAFTSPEEQNLLLELAGDLSYGVGALRTQAGRKQAEKERGQAEQKYRQIVENAVDGIFQSTPDGRFVSVNPALAHMWGYNSPEELIASITDIKHQVYVDPNRRAEFMHLLDGQDYVTGFEYQAYCKDGSLVWNSENARAVRDERGTLLYYEGTIEDITARVQAEKVQAVTYKISQVAISTASLEELYPATHSILGELMPLENFHIALFDPASDVLSYPYFVDQHNQPPPPHKPGRGLTEYVLRSGTPLLATPEVFDQLLQRGTVESIGTDCIAWLGVPLKVQGQMIGVMVAQSYTQGSRLGQKELELLEFASSQVGLAIDRKRAEQALRASEGQRRLIIEKNADGILIVNREGAVQFVNPAAEAIFGRPAEQLLGAEFGFPIGTDQASELEIWRPDGFTCVAEMRATELTWEGHPAYLTSLRDITERVQAEKLKDTLFEITNVANSTTSLDELYRSIHTAVGKLLPAENFYIALWDADKDEVSFPYFVDQHDSPPAPHKLGRGLTEYVLRTQAPLLASPEVFASLAQQGEVELIGKNPLDWLGVPLRVGDKTIGVMAVQSYTETVRFSQHEMDVLSFVSSQVAMAIERKQAEAQIQRQVETLGVLYDLSRTLAEIEEFNAILDVLTRRAVEATHVTFASVLLLERDDLIARSVFPVRALGHDLQVGQHEPLAAHSTLQHVLKGNDPLVLQREGPEGDEYAPFFLDVAQSLCVIPLHTREHPLGMLVLGEARAASREPFTTDKIHLALSIGQQAASNLHRVLLHEETHRRLRNIQTLRSIDQVINSSLDLRLTLDILLEHVTTQLRVDAAAVLLLNPHTQTLEYSARRGFRQETLQYTRMRLGEGYAGRAALERQLIHVPDLRGRKTDFLRSAHFSAEGFVAYYVVPLIAKGEVKGVLEVFQRAPLETDDEWMAFLETLAGQTAIAVDNIRLFEDLNRANTELVIAYDDTISGWSAALDLRDKETEGHTQRVTKLTEQLARRLGMHDEELVHVRRGSLLHDIGKMGVPDSILHKPGPLTEAEWDIMRKHPTFAFEMLRPIEYLHPALGIPYCHHEKWDGSGYPRGLQGEQIPLAARIFAVVDVWDALTSDRPYRKAWSREKTTGHIREQAGSHFDPQVVKVFLKEFTNEQ